MVLPSTSLCTQCAKALTFRCERLRDSILLLSCCSAFSMLRWLHSSSALRSLDRATWQSAPHSIPTDQDHRLCCIKQTADTLQRILLLHLCRGVLAAAPAAGFPAQHEVNLLAESQVPCPQLCALRLALCQRLLLLCSVRLRLQVNLGSSL